jgi:predicted signal transduction protein with EAL and GGDEF domain/FixJ family two-component response regulator
LRISAVTPVTSASLEDSLPEASPSVLLVDDDEVNLMVTALALRGRGFTVTPFSSGTAALGYLRSSVPDIVVLDALMPGLDGFETCERLRRLPALEHVPVLMLTGLDDDESISRAYRAGATDFFVKSPQWVLLDGRLRYLLRSSRTRQELLRSRARLARALDLARMGSFDWHPMPGRWDGRLELSAEAYPVLGLKSDREFRLRHLMRMVQRSDRHGVLSMLASLRTHRSVLATDVSVELDDGRRRVIHIEAEPDGSEATGGGSYSGVVQDVTDRRTAEDKIRHLANFDSLTGLPNRRQLLWRTERALEHARRQGHLCGLLLIDLDRFKVINDTLGHAAGDELLAEVAKRLRSCVRHSDQVTESATDTGSSRAHRTLEAVGRLGGDEFVALLPEVATEQDAERVASRILESMKAPIYVAGQECIVTASVGVALYPRDGLNMLDLMRNADVAMYSAKASGRNATAIYAPSLATSGRERLELETALHKAVERQELVLHYQPKVDVQSTRVVGAEALMRWKRAGQLVPPGDFIPLAEEIGLILPMSQWALGEATRQLRAWRDRFGFTQSIAVNLPSRLFERADLVDHIRLSALAWGVPLESIQLEITETGLMKGQQGVFPALHRLNEIGVRISIDDFGTGYSSLSYLTTLPISELKIDGSFVRDLGRTPQSEAVATAIIALSRSLGLGVVAEGVETVRQAQVLQGLGCNVMQGYLFSRPLPAEDFERWVSGARVLPQPPWIEMADAPPPGAERSGSSDQHRGLG